MFQKGSKKIAGRQKGSQNRLTRTVKETVLSAFNDLQSDPKNNILAFAQKYPRDFYQIAAKLIPTEVTAQVTQKIISVEYRNNLAGDSYTTPRAITSTN